MPILELHLRCSRLSRLFWLLGHSLALGAAVASALPLWIKLLGTVGLAGSAFFSWRRGGCPKLTALRYDGELWMLIGPGHAFKGELLPSTWCSRYLTLLHFRLESGRFVAVPVWRDSVSCDDWRRLQVVLHFGISWKR